MPVGQRYLILTNHLLTFAPSLVVHQNRAKMVSYIAALSLRYSVHHFTSNPLHKQFDSITRKYVRYIRQSGSQALKNPAFRSRQILIRPYTLVPATLVMESPRMGFGKAGNRRPSRIQAYLDFHMSPQLRMLVCFPGLTWKHRYALLSEERRDMNMYERLRVFGHSAVGFA